MNKIAWKENNGKLFYALDSDMKKLRRKLEK